MRSLFKNFSFVPHLKALKILTHRLFYTYYVYIYSPIILIIESIEHVELGMKRTVNGPHSLP